MGQDRFAQPVESGPEVFKKGYLMVKLFAFTCGWFQAPVGFFLDGGESEIIRSPVPAYLIQHPKGLALFDTGLGRRFIREAGFRLAPDVTGYEFDESADIAARLRSIDIDPRQVKWIVNSHFHVDHCGGNASIPNATIIVQRRERRAAVELNDGKLYNTKDFDVGHPVREIDGELDLFGDGSVLIFPSYGHTPGHQCARIKLPKGDVVLSADCCYLKRSLDELRVPPHNFDQELALDTLKRLRAMQAQGARIFYGHDGEFWKTVPQGVALR
ncbi:glyoxylase-like metal-dependent hydrolase (beta-lactamase superfamily II) [Pseudomonas sp. JAI111]|uniref:N-acyl homoserine lactonase family protein n=1 Tax=Pseudomonas sp. JAI111 TaxID=2735913 RepID=UPI00216A1D89|nr:N-acyl homoserine lactonase family protein [Pseudomonas sp. JAI111]MCS3835695.1 glyoxylase-like metal-dependent hydrolase (beta-lactamase superfamily II) [Pseudomonas sp. JAI111]